MGVAHGVDRHRGPASEAKRGTWAPGTWGAGASAHAGVQGAAPLGRAERDRGFGGVSPHIRSISFLSIDIHLNIMGPVQLRMHFLYRGCTLSPVELSYP